MFGALGSTWGHNFYMGTQSLMSREKWWSRIFDSHLSIKVMALWSFPICLYREAIRLQCLRPRATWGAWPRAHINVTTITRFAQNLHCGHLLPLCGPATYSDHISRCYSQLCSCIHWKACFSVYSTAKLAKEIGSVAILCAVFRTIFFFLLSVHSSLKITQEVVVEKKLIK